MEPWLDEIGLICLCSDWWIAADLKIISLRLRLLWIQSNYIRVAFQTVIFTFRRSSHSSVLPTAAERRITVPSVARRPERPVFNALYLSKPWELNGVELNKWRDSSPLLSPWANTTRTGRTSANSARTKELWRQTRLSESLIYEAAGAVLRSAVYLLMVNVRC